MSHLTAAEFVDLLEGRLSPERARHADACEMCRVQCDELRHALIRSSELTVPDPSPLFWDQLSAGVREGISSDAGASPPRAFWTRRAAVTWLGAAAAIVLVAVMWATASFRRVDPPMPANVAGVVTPEPHGDDWNEEAWAVVREAADRVAPEDVDEAGLGARPGAVETAMNGLTDKERARLILLLEEELKRSGE
jgi:hypothetical protein